MNKSIPVFSDNYNHIDSLNTYPNPSLGVFLVTRIMAIVSFDRVHSVNTFKYPSPDRLWEVKTERLKQRVSEYVGVQTKTKFDFQSQ